MPSDCSSAAHHRRGPHRRRLRLRPGRLGTARRPGPRDTAVDPGMRFFIQRRRGSLRRAEALDNRMSVSTGGVRALVVLRWCASIDDATGHCCRTRAVLKRASRCSLGADRLMPGIALAACPTDARALEPVENWGAWRARCANGCSVWRRRWRQFRIADEVGDWPLRFDETPPRGGSKRETIPQSDVSRCMRR